MYTAKRFNFLLAATKPFFLVLPKGVVFIVNLATRISRA